MADPPSSTVLTAPPAIRGTLIGRDRVVAEIVAGLTASRLVTVIGPGGAGKTRVAVAVANHPENSWPDGACWVDLTSLPAGRGGVGGVLARAVGGREQPGEDSIDLAVGLIGQRSVLIVLDNCEHLVDEIATLADRLLDDCPRVAVLATSREPLAVRGELVHPLIPLATPPQGEDPARIAGYDAVRMLVERARAVQPGFVLTVAQAPAAARICRRLDGLPLAIELAAARLRMLSIEEVATGLDEALVLLTGGPRTAPDRHQSLRAALDWSHDLLAGDEQRLLRRLAICPAGFGAQAAAAVADRSVSQVLNPLGRLVDKSFIVAVTAGRAAHYRQPEVVREYAFERLVQSGELHEVQNALADHVTATALAAADALAGPRYTEVLDTLDGELENIATSMTYLLAAGRLAQALRTGAVLWRFCYLRGHYRRGRQWLDAAAGAAASAGEEAAAAIDPVDRVEVLHGAGVLAFLQCDYPAAVRRLEAGLALARSLGDRRRSAAGLQMLAGVAREQGRYVRSCELYGESLEIYTALGNGWGVAKAQNYLAFLSWLQGDWDGARQAALPAQEFFSRVGDQEGMVWSLINLGVADLLTGALGAAEQRLSYASEIARRADYPEGLAWTTHEQGLLSLRRGDPGAIALLRQAATRHRELGDRWRLASVLADLAVATICSDTSAAALAGEFLGAADALWESIGSRPAPSERDLQDSARERSRAELGDDGYARAWQQGRVRPLDELLAAVGRTPIPAPPVTVAAQTPSAASAQIRVQALGGARVWVGPRELAAVDWGYAKPRELFFLLASGGPLGKEQIGRMLWPDLDSDRLRGALHTALRDLRRAVGPVARVSYARGRYRIDSLEAGCVDVLDFEQALTRAIERDPLLEAAHRDLMLCWLHSGEPARAVRHYHQLVARLRDDLGVEPAPQTRAVYQRIARA